ncbi:MAG: hypothetical protein C0391_03495 [Anaerolinea sp.]|nr:hypothetical protein [Anaerolinea sp.]
MLIINSAKETERQTLSDFLEQTRFNNKHLDWQSIISWLGTDVFLTCRDNAELVSTLVCPILEADFCWIRAFHANTELSAFSTWRPLLNELECRCQAPGIGTIYSISLSTWYSELLKQSGFITTRQIITLQKDIDPSHLINDQLFPRIRALTPADLIKVADIDHAAFPPMWQLTKEDLSAALKVSEYASVVTDMTGEIIGYMLSSQTNNSTHISRIAVLPTFQKQNVAKELLDHLSLFLTKNGVRVASVNTSSDNPGALALYKHHGFNLTDGSYPIYEKKIG